METWVFFKGQASVTTELSELPEHYDFIWIDLSPKEMPTLTNILQNLFQVTMHEQHLLDCTNKNHPAAFDSMQDYDLLVFRNLSKARKSLQMKTSPVVFIILNKMLITIHQNDAVINNIKQKTLDPKRAHPKQMNTLLCQILNSIIDNYLSLREPLSAQYRQWQEKLLDERARFKGWRDLLAYKTIIQRLSMLCEQLLDSVNQWRQAIDNEINENFDVRLTDVSDHIRRVSRFSYQLERQLESLMQLHYSLISTRTNEVMRMLTVISGIFLPLTLLTGIFGMNFSQMPFVKFAHGFGFLVVFMATLACVLLGIFRYRKWI